MRSHNNKAQRLVVVARKNSNGRSFSGSYTTCLHLGDFIATIIPDREVLPLHHLVVQRLGSRQILLLGQEPTFADAVECGNNCLERLTSEHRHLGVPVSDASSS